MPFFFSENNTVDDISKVPESYRGMYQQQGEQHVLQDAFKPAAVNIDSLARRVGNQEEALSRLGTERDQLRAYRVDGFDTGEAMQAELTRLRQVETGAGKGAKALDEARTEWQREHQQIVAAKDERIGELEGTIMRNQKAGDIAAAMTRFPHKVLPEWAEVVDNLMGQRVQVARVTVEGQEQFVTRVMKADGSGVAVDEAMNPLGLDGLLRELHGHKTYGNCFAGEPKRGGGVHPSHIPGSPPPGAPQHRSSHQKIATGLTGRTGTVHGAGEPS